jgi:uncharacterized membrane protein YccF (DUF307 family)
VNSINQGSQGPTPKPTGCLSMLGNIIWFLVGGIWLALGFLLSAVIFCILIFTIPLAKQCLKLAMLSLLPFGKQVVSDPSSNPSISVLGNVLWVVLCGFWMALGFLISGVLACLTIVGIPFGLQAFKLAGLALFPFGKRII